MANFCPHCGSQLLRPGAVFCATCGQSLGAGQPSVPGGNRGAAVVVQVPGQAAQTKPLTKSPFKVGRAPAPTNDLVLDHPAVSREHFQLEQRGNTYYLVDQHSTNGTMVNGLKVQDHPLKDGDIIRIGDQHGNSVGLTFRHGSGSQPHYGTIDLGQHNLTQQRVLTIGRDPTNLIPLDHPIISRFHARIEQTTQGAILRDLNSSNGTFINHRPVHGVQPLQPHDEILIGPFKLVYNQGQVMSYAPAGNYRLDAINLARSVTVGGGWLPRLNGNSTHRKLILNNINLSIYPKEFVALVGGSGTGKSTLMKALSGYVPAQGQVLVNGDDLYANFAAYRNILGYVPQDDIIHHHLTVQGALRYAAQLRLPDATAPDIAQRINHVLTEVEMAAHANKQVKDLSGGQRKRVSIAAELLAEPGLFFLDEPTSGLDPGLEKKMMHTMRTLADAGRTIVLVTHATVNIDQCTHVAFMADGHLAYFGPPQEALTFFEAPDFADIYTRLTQPLDPAQNSLPPRCQPYLNEIQITQPQPPTAAQVWARAFEDSPQHRKYVADRLQAVGAGSPPPLSPGQPQRKTPASLPAKFVQGIKQFSVLTQRYFELIWRDAFSLFILMAVMPLIGLLLLIMANQYDLIGKNPDGIDGIKQEIQQSIEDQRKDQNQDKDDEEFKATYEVASQTQKLLFMMALAANLLGIFAAAYEIVKEESIYRRERMVNLKIVPYLSSKMMVLAGFALLQSFLFLLVVRLGVEYPTWGVFLPAVLEMYITLVLATLASLSLGLLISAMVRSGSTVIYLILLILFVQIIFAGAIFDLPNLAKPVSYLTTSRWTLEALGSTVDMNRLNDKAVTCIEFEDPRMRRLQEQSSNERTICKDNQMEQTVDYEFNVNYSHNFGSLIGRWAVLGLFSAVFGLVTMYVQKQKDVI